MTTLKIGELAQRTGLTVRTLHHYDEIGLLTPSRRTEAGYRLYGEQDVVRLTQIRSLRQMGWSLDKIRGFLARPDLRVLEIIDLHLTRLRERLELQQSLCDRLERVAQHLRTMDTASVEDLLKTIEVMTMYEKYYSPEQTDWLKQRAQQVGEERIREVEAEWREVFAGFRIEMDRDADPASAASQALARKAQSLIAEFTGGNPGIQHALGTMYQQEGASKVLEPHGFELAPGVGEFMARAMAALGTGDSSITPPE